MPCGKDGHVSFRSNFGKKKAISYSFKRDVGTILPFQYHFKGFVEMAGVCLNCSEMSYSIFCLRVAYRSGPL